MHHNTHSSIHASRPEYLHCIPKLMPTLSQLNNTVLWRTWRRPQFEPQLVTHVHKRTRSTAETGPSDFSSLFCLQSKHSRDRTMLSSKKWNEFTACSNGDYRVNFGLSSGYCLSACLSVCLRVKTGLRCLHSPSRQNQQKVSPPKKHQIKRKSTLTCVKRNR